MTKKDFELIARTIKATKPVHMSHESNAVFNSKISQFDKTVYEFTNMLAEQNPRFNRRRFIDACN